MADRIRLERGDDGVVLLTFDAPGAAVNTMDAAFFADFEATLAALEADRPAGVILTSAKPTFFAGGDLEELLGWEARDAPAITAHVDRIKAALRRLETLGAPVVAAINGAALGGGLEIALACHRRVVAAGAPVGTPEVTLGLLPGGGGVVRSVRLLGVATALDRVLLPGRPLAAADALALGLVDEVVDEADAVVPAARSWLAGDPPAVQPWDVPGFAVGDPVTDLAARAEAFAAGPPLPAPPAILRVAIEGAGLDLDAASALETEAFVELVVGRVAKNLIRTTFFDMAAVRGGAARPADVAPYAIRRLGVIGAGMMGAGIAYQAARQGLEVVLADVSLEAAERGKGYAAKRRGDAALLARITPTADLADLAGCDAVVEAVFEDPDLKRRILREAEGHLAPGALLTSNTSTLPITELATGVARPDGFAGTHFFSPVDRMPLLEIVVGARTSDTALAQAFDLAAALRKTPIAVNDSRGFFTSRVISAYIDETLTLLGDGVPAEQIEAAALRCGYPVAPLQLLDETTITLPHRVRAEARAAAAAAGTAWVEHPAEAIMDRLVADLGVGGRASGRGFYDYDADGRRTGLWVGLAEHFGGQAELPPQDLGDRLLFCEALETARCLAEGVLRSAADANVGSILGIGYPAWTGGVVRYVHSYPGGVPAFAARARELAERYGERFAPPAILADPEGPYATRVATVSNPSRSSRSTS